MNRKELYYRTVDILYDAYFNDMLEYRSHASCAVATLIVHNMGFQLDIGAFGRHIYGWLDKNKNEISCFTWYSLLLHEDIPNCSKEQEYLASTGYTLPELRLIAQAFEFGYQEGNDRKERRKNTINGLWNVLDVLKDIHEKSIADFDTASVNSEDGHAASIVDSLVERYERSVNSSAGIKDSVLKS